MGESRGQTEAAAAAAKARAVLKGQTEWGRYASATEHERYMEPADNRRRKCHCGCGGRITHYGLANGLGLMGGCEMSVRRWVRNPAPLVATPPSEPPTKGEVK